MPRLTNIGPPGSANALISRTFTGFERVVELGVLELARNGGDQTLADVLDVRRHLVVAHDRQLLSALCCAACVPELDVLGRRVVVVRRRNLGLRRNGCHRQHERDDGETAWQGG